MPHRPRQLTDLSRAEDSAGCARYATCQAAVEVVLCTKEGGSDDPADATVAWPILKRHVLAP
jgi:hypothetical protein